MFELTIIFALKKKTFIFFLPNFSQGGAAESISKLMIYLAKKKYECVLICLNKCFYKKQLTKYDIKIFEIFSNKTLFSMLKIRGLINSFIIHKKKITLISNINYANILSIIFFRSLKNLKIILYERTPIQELDFDYGSFYRKIKNKTIKFLMFLTYRFSDKIIANSKTTSFDLSKLTKQKVITIYSKSIKKIKPFKKKFKNKINILWIGRFSKEKSLDTLIDAIKIINDDEIKVFILSNDINKRDYLKKINKLKLTKRFVFCGYKKNLTKYFNSTNLYISTSLYESFPNSVIQAINNSLPIITSKSFGGINEIIQNNFSGVFFETNNSKALSQKILNFKKNKKKYENFALNAHNALNKFSFDRIEKDFENELLNL
jgi:glycosyltransferase involved in cell wall biosynthesis